MIKETLTTVRLIASEGHILTNGETYGKIVYLGQGNDGEKWYEITDEEYQKILEETEGSIK